jgi:tetratricopeptide (TPR) repeat protein
VPYLPTLYGVGQVPTLRPQLARLLAALGPGLLPADLGTVVLLAWAEADLADGTLPLEEARRALDAWREVLLTDAGAAASLPGLLHAMLAARSYLSARRVADFAVLRRDLHPSTYANALFVAQAAASGLPVDRALDERLLAACLPHAPSNPAVYVNAACLYLELGALDDAHRALAQALVHGRNEPVRNVLGSLLFAPYRDDPRFADLRKVMDAP